MNFVTEMDNIIADFYKSTDEIIKKAKSTGKEGKRGKGDTTHCYPSTLNLRPTTGKECKHKTAKEVWNCPKCNAYLKNIIKSFEDIPSTLQPIEKIKFEELKSNDGLFWYKLNQLIDRINLLSIKIKEQK